MTTSIPDYVTEFLVLTKELKDLRNQEKTCTKGLAELQPRMRLWLREVPSFELKLQFDEEEHSNFGDDGKLKFLIERRKENLSLTSLDGYLCSFFTQVYPEKSHADLDELSKAAASFVWQSRKTTTNNPTVQRTYVQARKRKRGKTES